MDIKELRVGNLLQSEIGLIRVESILGSIYRVYCHSLDEEYLADYNLKDVFAIPLTEEWLVKFGLIKKYVPNQFIDGGFELKPDGSRWYYWVDDGIFNLEIQENGEIWFEIYSHYKCIEYVHQLQNLYRSLTGEDLSLNHS